MLEACLVTATVLLGAGCGGHERTAAGSQRFNVLLVTVDTLRADHVGALGGPDGITPNLDRLVAGGTTFDHAVSTAPLTLPSHATILTGVLPVHHGLRNNGGAPLDPSFATLAESFSSAGYRTAAFVGSFVLDRRFGLARGFDVYDDLIDRDDGDGGLEAERPAREVVDPAIKWLESSGEPFFAWVHLYDPHAPYEPPEPFATAFPHDPYSGEISYADEEIGRLLQQLQISGAAARTIVVVVADHGEALGEHGELTHGLLLFEPTLRVPMIVSGPGIGTGVRISNPVSLADLAPTILDFVGVPERGMPDGRDLSATLRSGTPPGSHDIYSETHYPELFGWAPLRALRRGDYKLIQATTSRLYDLDADPGETREAGNEQRRALHDLEEKLAALLETERVAAPIPRPDAEAIAKLESLGYVGGAPETASGQRPDPHDMVPLFRRFEEATWALGSGRPLEAARELQSLVKEDSRNPVFRGSLAKALRGAGHFREAIPLYQEAIALAPDDAEAWYNLATALREAGRNDEAASAMMEVLKRDKRRPEAHNVLGIIRASEGRSEEAIASFREALAIDPRNARAMNNLGNVYRDLGRLDEATEAYRQATEIDDDYPDPLNGLGAVQIAMDRPGDAIPYFDRAIALAPDNLEISFNRAIALDLSGRRAEAIDGYRTFMSSARGHDEFASQARIAAQLLERLLRGPDGPVREGGGATGS